MEFVKEKLEFEWDKGNIKKNFIKHNVKRVESEHVFFNEPLLVKKDNNHSQKETRYFCLGQTNKGRKLFVSFTIRSGRIRIISARPMDRKEQNKYAKA